MLIKLFLYVLSGGYSGEEKSGNTINVRKRQTIKELVWYISTKLSTAFVNKPPCRLHMSAFVPLLSDDNLNHDHLNIGIL